ALDQDVVVRGSEVDVIGLDPHLVLDVLREPVGPKLEQLGERPFRSGVMPMLGNHDRLLDLAWKVREDLADGVEATPRSADADQLKPRKTLRIFRGIVLTLRFARVGVHEIFLYSRSFASSSSYESWYGLNLIDS